MELKIRTSAARQGQAAQAAYQTAAEERPEAMSKEERRQKSREDKLELSRQAVEFIQGKSQEGPGQIRDPQTPEEKRQQEKLEQVKSIKQMLDAVKQQSEQMRKQTEQQSKALKESMETMKRCAKIARNIGKGLKVPPKDIQYLIETDPNQYMLAMVLRMMEEEKNEKAKSELKDKQQEQNSAEQPAQAGGVEGAGSQAPVDISAIGGKAAASGTEAAE